MEATSEETGFLDKIRPPPLEEAGLEDCALPPDLIKEAFRKAAAAVSSVFSSGDGECTNDPLPGEASPSPADELVGSGSVGVPSKPCATEKGGIGDGYRGPDLVGSGFLEAKEDVIVPPVEKEGGDCVDGLRGLTIGEKEVEDEEEEDSEGPILVEGYLV